MRERVLKRQPFTSDRGLHLLITLPRQPLGFLAFQGHLYGERMLSMMPLTHFLALLTFVILAAGLTIGLAVWADLPLVALGLAALAGSLILGARQWR